jgi:LmbE family N-acetylglucosaminyl deacetylase
VKHANTGGVVVVSPHRDDAVLSLGGLLQSAPRLITVINVFNVSGWTREGQRPDRVGAISRARAKEDRRALKTLGVRPGLAVGFPEGPLRGIGFDCLFDGDAAVRPSELKALTKALKALFVKLRPQLVLAPLGLGGHVDHCLARLAVSQLARTQSFRWACYEDLPYARHLSLAKLQRQAKNVLGEKQGRLVLRLSPRQRAMKLKALRAYPSQLVKRDLQHVLNHARRVGGGERLHFASTDRAQTLAALRSIFRDATWHPPR